MQRCDECGFDYTHLDPADVPGRLRSFGARYGAAFASVAQPRQRPAPTVWSPLEYACHVRDVFAVQRQRLALALAETQPAFVPMGRDELAVRERYNDQDPDVVLADLAAGAGGLAEAFEALTGDQWSRTGVYPWPEPTVRDMVWLGRHTVHEGEHHLTDLTRYG